MAGATRGVDRISLQDFISLGTQTFQVPGRVHGETSGCASIESEFGSRRTHRKP